MMQLNDRHNSTLFQNKDIVLAITPQLSFVKHDVLISSGMNGELYVYTISSGKKEIIKNSKNVLHYLDVFWIVLPDDQENQRKLWKAFYDSYVQYYESLINTANNISCLELFKTIITEKTTTLLEKKILDFGCGTGLSAKVFGNSDILCYDNNPVMRQKALRNGLKTIDRERFLLLEDELFDICIACYVFHLTIDKYDLMNIIRVIKKEGLIIANFYKCINENEVNSFMRENGQIPEKINIEEGTFGSVFMYRKAKYID